MDSEDYMTDEETNKRKIQENNVFGKRSVIKNTYKDKQEK